MSFWNKVKDVVTPSVSPSPKCREITDTITVTVSESFSPSVTPSASVSRTASPSASYSASVSPSGEYDYFNREEELEAFLDWCKDEYPQIVTEYDMTKGIKL